MYIFCDSRVFKTTEIKSKKKSIQRHNRLVKKEKTIKGIRRRHPDGWKGRFVRDNNFLCMLKKAVGDDVVQLETANSIVHELKAETAMKKPTDSVRYVLPQYVSGENDEYHLKKS